jgi:hypothetical protein
LSFAVADLAYLAGIIDGEGCFLFEPRKREGTQRACLQIRMNDIRVMTWIHKTFGGQLRKRRPANKNSEHGFLWKMRKHKFLKDLLQNIMPYLITKKLHAHTVLEFLETFKKGSGNGGYTAEEKTQMDVYSSFLKSMNSRGPGSNEIKANLYAVSGF